MKYLNKMFRCKSKVFLLICCLSVLLTSEITANLVPVHAAVQNTKLYFVALSPLQQQVNLSQPSAAAPGGRGYMTPQQVYIATAPPTYGTSYPDGVPLTNVPVTFEVSGNNLVTSVMRGFNKKTITVFSDGNGIATAANTYQGFIGEGFQIWSTNPYVSETFTVKASAPGCDPVIFYVKANTIGSY